MLDELAAAIATGAAGNIIAYMLSGRVDALRAQVTGIFRHGTEHERAVALRALEDDVVASPNRGHPRPMSPDGGSASCSPTSRPTRRPVGTWKRLLLPGYQQGGEYRIAA